MGTYQYFADDRNDIAFSIGNPAKCRYGHADDPQNVLIRLREHRLAARKTFQL